MQNKKPTILHAQSDREGQKNRSLNEVSVFQIDLSLAEQYYWNDFIIFRLWIFRFFFRVVDQWVCPSNFRQRSNYTFNPYENLKTKKWIKMWKSFCIVIVNWSECLGAKKLLFNSIKLYIVAKVIPFQWTKNWFENSLLHLKQQQSQKIWLSIKWSVLVNRSFCVHKSQGDLMPRE